MVHVSWIILNVHIYYMHEIPLTSFFIVNPFSLHKSIAYHHLIFTYLVLTNSKINYYWIFSIFNNIIIIVLHLNYMLVVIYLPKWLDLYSHCLQWCRKSTCVATHHAHWQSLIWFINTHMYIYLYMYYVYMYRISRRSRWQTWHTWMWRSPEQSWVRLRSVFLAKSLRKRWPTLSPFWQKVLMAALTPVPNSIGCSTSLSFKVR